MSRRLPRHGWTVTIVAAVGQWVAMPPARGGREVAVIQGRLGEVQDELNAAEARLADTRVRLGRERCRLGRLQRRLAAGRELLAAQLVSAYKADRPDLVSVVFGSTSFADLLERFEFIERVQDRNAQIVERVRGDLTETRRQAHVLTRLAVQQQRRAVEVERRHAALTTMRAAVMQRQAELQRARAARAAALTGTRSGRARAERALRRLLAQRARAAVGSGSGGPWAIPWPVVQCESGGQNLPPNAVGASGYYQFLTETWRRMGGSTPHARRRGGRGELGLRRLGLTPARSLIRSPASRAQMR